MRGGAPSLCGPHSRARGGPAAAGGRGASRGGQQAAGRCCPGAGPGARLSARRRRGGALDLPGGALRCTATRMGGRPGWSSFCAVVVCGLWGQRAQAVCDSANSKAPSPSPSPSSPSSHSRLEARGFYTESCMVRRADRDGGGGAVLACRVLFFTSVVISSRVVFLNRKSIVKT